MSSLGLIESYWKTERAKHHLDELKATINKWADSNPYVVTPEDDIEKALHKITIKFSEPHVWIHLIAGDVFHCLRSALDYAIFTLAKDTIRFPEGTQFPVFEEKPVKPSDIGRFKSQTKGVSAEAVAYIESLQPYNRPNGIALPECALWILNKMSNIEKHRRIPVHSLITNSSFDFIPNAQVARANDSYIVTVPLSRKPKVALDPTVSFDIRFGDTIEGVQVGVEEIERIYELVSWNWIPALQRFCKKET